MSHGGVPGWRTPGWMQSLPFFRPEGYVYTPGRSQHDFCAYTRFEHQGQEMIQKSEVYLSKDDGKELIHVQVYCPFCWKGNGVPQPELMIRNHGDNPKTIDFFRVPKWNDLPLEDSQLEGDEIYVMTVGEVITCSYCGKWSVKITRGYGKSDRLK